MPRGGVLARFYRPGGVRVLNSFYGPSGGEFAYQKNCPGVLPAGEWSGLELTDTLTLPFPSLLVPTPGGVGRADPPAISKPVVPMNVKFCRVLETPLKVLEMLKLLT